MTGSRYIKREQVLNISRKGQLLYIIIYLEKTYFRYIRRRTGSRYIMEKDKTSSIYIRRRTDSKKKTREGQDKF